MKLTKTMKEAVDYIRETGGTIHRHPGGFWAKVNWTRFDGHFGTPTIEALVKRRVLRYTKIQVGRNGQFPIQAELI